MNTLTKEQRLEVYKRVLSDLNQGKYSCGLCPELYDYAEDLYNIEAYKEHLNVRTLFPEFADKKPIKCTSLYWWPLNKEGRQIRIKVLQEIIKEMKDE